MSSGSGQIVCQLLQWSYLPPPMSCDTTTGSIRFDQTCSSVSRARCGMASSDGAGLILYAVVREQRRVLILRLV